MKKNISIELSESEFMYNFGEKIKAIRLKKDISIEYLSEKSKIPEKLLIKIESGTECLQLSEFVEIIKALGEKPETFFEQ